ncbi:hypothetical protein HMPREF9278_0318 [Mobiluncus mulieris FB024-16]|nr:hypothetical protein HMPREF9278_0318 [Mobiluncus mulieris FB024-16]
MQCREFCPRCADSTLTIARVASGGCAGGFCACGDRAAALAVGLSGGVVFGLGLVFPLALVFSGS